MLKLRSLPIWCWLAASSLGSCGVPQVEEPPVIGRTASGLHYQVSGSGASVILVHAFSLDRRMWDRQVEALERSHRVVRFDQRGHGLSDEPTEPYATHTDLLEIYQTLDIEGAALVGISSGAEAAVDFAIAYPRLVDRLVLASPGLSGYVPKGSFDWMAEVISALQAGDAEVAMRHWVETPLMAIGDPQTDARVREIGLSNWRIWTYSPEHRRTLDPPATGRLAEITVPTLVVVGELDLPDTLRVGELLVAGVADIEKVSVPSAGHLVSLAAPMDFNEAMLEFLDGEAD